MTQMTMNLEQMLAGQADRIGARIGADPASTRTAVSAAIPTLLAALSQEANDPGLRRAIERDHDGSVIDNLDGYVDGTATLNPRATDGVGILEHTLGDRQEPVARALSAKTGLDFGTIMQLLPLLAPIVMGMLGKQARTEGSSSGGGLGDLGSILGGLTGAGAGTAGSQAGGLDDVLGSILGGNRR